MRSASGSSELSFASFPRSVPSPLQLRPLVRVQKVARRVAAPEKNTKVGATVPPASDANRASLCLTIARTGATPLPVHTATTELRVVRERRGALHDARR